MDEKRAYKQWKHERKMQHKEESYRAHHERRGHPLAEHPYPLSESDASDREEYDSYVAYKQSKAERKQQKKEREWEEEMMKKQRKEEKHHKGHYRRYYYSDSDSGSEAEFRRQAPPTTEQQQHSRELRHDDYRKWKYEEDLPKKQWKVEEKQREADEKFADFKWKHPYMPEEELALYKETFEVEPYFATKAEQEAYRQKKKDEAVTRERKQEQMKKQREADEEFVEFKYKHPYMSEDELNLYHKKYEVEPIFATKAEREAYKKQKKDEADLLERKKETAQKNREADKKFADFKIKHPYMNEEELALYHEHFEAEPIFATKAEKDAWYEKKKEAKFISDRKKIIAKEEREMREMEEAYKLTGHVEYSSDSDSDSDSEAEK